MSALPLFTVLPPAQPSAALEKPVSPSPPPSALASEATGDEVLSPALMNEANPQGSNDSDGATSFWDTLQQQAASTDPALGQNISALNSSLSDTISDHEIAVDELTVENIQVQGVDPLIDQSTKEPLMVTPWSSAVIQSPGSQQDFANPAMDQILSQRSAQPQVQSQAGVLSPIELQSKSILDAPLSQGMMAPVMTEEVAKASQPMTGQLAQMAGAGTKPILDKETGGLSSGMTLDESLMMKEPINIHEKPITLAMPDAITAPAMTQTTSTTQDFALMETADGLDALQTTTGQNTKDLAQGSKVLTSSTEMADKVLSGQARIDVPPSSPKFTEQIAQRIGIMSTEQLQTARIQLDPPELGSLEIKIRVQQDQVSVAFSSGHQVVRDALEAQSPRLREMLEQQGVELTDVNVSDQQQQSAGEGNSEGVPDEGGEDWVDDEMNEEVLITEAQSDSLVDYFA